MTELSALFERLADEPLAPLPSIEDLTRRNRRRRRRTLLRAGSGVAAAVVAAVLVAVLTTPATSPARGLASYLVPATKVPLSVLEQVGVPSTVKPPTPMSGKPALEAGGKAEVFYAGAAFCPFCAVSRWALVIALSEFGTFTDLGSIVSSSSSDVYPNLESWSFARSTYTSPYLSFDPVEISYHRTGQAATPGPATGYVPLATISAQDRHLIEAYDGAGTIPFIDIANKDVVVGADASPSALEGLSLGQISADLSDPSSPVAKALDGAANSLVADICGLVGTASAQICRAPFVQQQPSTPGGASGAAPPGTTTSVNLVTRLTEPGPDGSTITLQTSSPNSDRGCVHLVVSDPKKPPTAPVVFCAGVSTPTLPPTTTTPTTSFGSGTQTWRSPSGTAFVIVYGEAPTGTTSAKLVNGPTGTVITGDVRVFGRFFAYPALRSLTHARDELVFYDAAGKRVGSSAL